MRPLLVMLPLSLALWSAEETAGKLTRAAEVRGLDEAAAESGLPVRIRGVVILTTNRWNSAAVIQDESAAIYCWWKKWPAGMKLNRGDLVEITGHSKPGEFAPIVVVDSANVIGTGEIPPPTPVDYSQLASPGFDSQPVEVSGIVRSLSYSGPERNRWLVELATGGGRLNVSFDDRETLDLEVDGKIRISGVCLHQFSNTGQLIKPMLAVPPGVSPVLLQPPPEEVPLRQLNQLMSFNSAGAIGHRVRVMGTVTGHLHGVGFWIEEGGRGLFVRHREETSLKRSEWVEVTGFPILETYSPELEDVTVKLLGEGNPPGPLQVASAAEALDHDATLISLNATLVEQMQVPQGLRLVFRDSTGSFPGLLWTDQDPSATDTWETGSEVRVSGICQVSQLIPKSEPGVLKPQSFNLYLRSPADVTVLKSPPWWNAERRARLLGVTTLVLALVVAFIIRRSRFKLRQSAAARHQSEAEFAAIIAERNRIAREIHDTLAQGLGAISLHIEAVKDHMPVGSAPAEHLRAASSITQDSMRRARDSIWNIRSRTSGQNSLESTLARTLDQLTEPADIESNFLVTGTRCRLAPEVEQQLQRIGQEAVVNAIKHARAKHIEVTLGFHPREVTIHVVDDGCGFDPAQAPADGSHFGLLGLRERAAEIGASLQIDSAPGKGTDVLLRFPLPQEEPNAGSQARSSTQS